MNKIIYELTILLPQAEIIGATTAGEIFEGKALKKSTVISFSIFEETTIKTKILRNNNNEYVLRQKIVKHLVEEDTRAIILFSNGLLTQGEEVLQGIESKNKKIIICGGKAGDNGYLKNTLVFTKDGFINNGIVAASLLEINLNVTTEYYFGWTPIGKTMTITKASKNIIYELFYKVLENVKRTRETFTLCAIDLNNFKIINDNFGHEMGDIILNKFATIFKQGITENKFFL